MRRQLRSYSSSSSTASTCAGEDPSPDSASAFGSSGGLDQLVGGGGSRGERDACSSGLPMAAPSYWRQGSVDSMRSNSSYWSDDEESSITSVQTQVEDSLAEASSSSNSSSSDVPDATPSSLRSARHLGVPSTIREDEPVVSAVLTQTQMQRTRSLPVPRTSTVTHPSSTPLSPTSADAAAASSASVAACSSSSAVLPSAHPGFGSSQSWTPGQPPPPGFVAIEPLSPEQQRRQESGESPPQTEPPRATHDMARSDGAGRAQSALSLVDSSFFPPLSLSSSSPWWSSAVLAHGAVRSGSDTNGLSNGGGVGLVGVGLDTDAVSRAPPPSRAPSLQRQKGVYTENTSRAISMPPMARRRWQEQMAADLREREEQARLLQITPAPLSPPSLTHFAGSADIGDGHPADSDELPPLG